MKDVIDRTLAFSAKWEHTMVKISRFTDHKLNSIWLGGTRAFVFQEHAVFT